MADWSPRPLPSSRDCEEDGRRSPRGGRRVSLAIGGEVLRKKSGLEPVTVCSVILSFTAPCSGDIFGNCRCPGFPGFKTMSRFPSPCSVLFCLMALTGCRGVPVVFPPPEKSAAEMKAAGYNLPRDLVGRYTTFKSMREGAQFILKSPAELEAYENGKWHTFRVRFYHQPGGWWEMGWMDIERPPSRVELYRRNGQTVLGFLPAPGVGHWPWGNYLSGSYLKLPD